MFWGNATMKISALCRLGLLALLALTPAYAPSAFIAPALAITGETAEFVKLADDVYAYVGRRNDANAMVIVTNQGVVLVDTGNNQPDARDIAQKIKSVTDQPVRWVVISQYHGDHFGGSPLFTPPATLIVHDRVARDLAAMKPHQIKSWRKRFPERAAQLEGLAPKDMMMSFSDRMTLNLGGKKIGVIAGDLQDAESMKAALDLFGGLGVKNLDCRQDGTALGAGPRESWLFNTTLAGIEQADVVLLVGTNPRHEAPEVIVAQIVGGFAGGRLVRVLPARAVRAAVIATGASMSAIYAWRYWL
jgi:hypothetical protein